MEEKPIERFIRVSGEKLEVEVKDLVHTQGIFEEYMKLGRLQAIAESIKFAITCKNQEGLDG